MAQFWLSYIDALIKLGQFADAQALLDQAKRRALKVVALISLSNG